MEKFTLKISNASNIQFNGMLIASAETSDNSADGRYYSFTPGRWTELNIYKTKKGNFICHRADLTRWENGIDCFSGKVCKTEGEVIDFFGHGWLAKELYEDAGIGDIVNVD